MTAPRRRVVMVVDNHVEGDSRVQKVAMSAAQAGWDVVLLGRSKTGATESYDLGGAEVRLIPVPSTLLGYPNRVPGRRWRWPLSYTSREIATFHARQLDALKSALAERHAVHKLQGASVPTRALTKALSVRVKGQTAWFAMRNGQLRKAAESHKSDGPVARTRATALHRLAPRACWRRLDPFLVDLGLAFEPALRDLKPDLIHAHDFRMAGVAVRVAEQRRARGHACKVVYDAHEFLPGVRYRTKAWHLGNEAHELRYVRRADAVVTVSERLAEMLVERHSLPATPEVVLNAPALRADAQAPDGGVRTVVRLGEDVPLIVYAGSPSPQRGLATVVHGLLAMPDVHAAMLLPAGKHATDLIALAEGLRVAERLHVLPYVAQDLVVPFLRSADVGLVPIHHHINHEIALITKYFDYSLAELPIVTSDVQTMGDVTRAIGNGEVFVAEDVDDFVRAVRAVLADPDRYRKAYTPEVLESWTWRAQERTLLGLYDRLVPASGPST